MPLSTTCGTLFHRPANLKEITPDHMGFDITSGDLPEKNVSRDDYQLQGESIIRYKNELGDRNKKCR